MSDQVNPVEQGLKSISEQIEGFKTTLEGKADLSDLNAAKATLDAIEKGHEATAEQLKQINEAIEGAANEITAIKSTQEKMRIEKANKGRFNTTEYEEKVKNLMDAARNGEKHKFDVSREELDMASKAAENIGTSTFYTDGEETSAFTGREIDPEFYETPRKTNLAIEAFGMTPIGVPTLLYMYKEEDTAAAPVSGDSGGADWIASGAAKPQRSFRGRVASVEAKKAATFANVEDKLLRDVASFENWLREDLSMEVLEVLNDGILSNNPGTNANGPLGIKTNAVTFSATTAFADFKAAGTSNLVDQIVAVLAQIAVARETPRSIVVAPDVYYKLHTLASSAGGFLNSALVYNPVNNSVLIAGTRVIPADVLDVPSTHILATSDAFKVRSYGGMSVEVGLNGEDFRQDKTSFRAYQEVLSYIAPNRYAGVVYDTFANVITGIEGV